MISKSLTDMRAGIKNMCSVIKNKLNPVQKASFRLLLRFLLIFVMLNILVTPVILNRLRDHMAHNIFNNGVLATQMLQIRSLTDREKEILINYQHVRGVQFYDKQTGHLKWVWFDRDNMSLKEPLITDLDFDKSIKGYIDLYRLMTSSGDENALIVSRDETLQKRITVVYQHASLSEYMAYQSWGAVVLLGFISFSSVLLMSGYFRREVSLSLSDLLLTDPSQQNVSEDKKDTISSMENRIAHHIEEQSRLASLGAGTARLAHDIRNVLTSLQLFADKLRISDDAKNRTMGARMNISIERAVSLCDWTARYSTNTQKTLNYSSESVKTLIDEVLTLVRLHDVANRVRLINKVSPEQFMDCERTLAFRIIYNIVLNAIQAIKSTDKRGHVILKSRREASGVTLIIEDNGPGMAQETIDKLFIPYQGSLKSGGTGLGMAIADEFAKWHGGYLELLSTSENGSVFAFYVPDEISAQGADKKQFVA